MTIEEQLKSIILSQYKSVRAFTTSISIPYTTLDSVFKRGICKAGVETMLKVFAALNLDLESIATGTLTEKKTPLPERPDKEAAPISLDALYAMLVAQGYVKDGEDLSDEDLRFLVSVGDVIRAWFAKGQ